MNVTDTQIGSPADVQSDHDAVMAHYLTGQPLDPVAERVRARAQLITEELRRRYGEMNIAVDLLHESRERA